MPVSPYTGLVKIGASADRAKDWIGVDLDGTLAEYKGYKGPDSIGAPVPAMVKRVKAWLDKGEKVKIFTARANMPKAVTAIKAWCKEHLGKELPVTNVKDHRMRELWDDRAHRVEKNTGVKLAGLTPQQLNKLIPRMAVYPSTIPRPIIEVPVRNGKSVLLYRSSQGTSGKTPGSWYPFFGFSRNPSWFIKGDMTGGKGDWLKQMSTGYGDPSIRDAIRAANLRYGRKPVTQIVSAFKRDPRYVADPTQLAKQVYGRRYFTFNENTPPSQDLIRSLLLRAGAKLPQLDGNAIALQRLRAAIAKNQARKATQKSAQAVPGIEDMAVYGDVLGTLKPGDITDFVLQRHDTKRNPRNPHYDLRLGTKDTNLFSWAVPGATLPAPGQFKRPVPQTQLHTYQYGSFEGSIPHGYGAGKVTMADKGKAIVTKVTPNTLHFTLGHTRVPTRYVLIHTGGRTGRMWQLYARPQPSSVPGVGAKPVYKAIDAADQDEAIAQAMQLQEKIDGAHGIIDINDKGDVDVYSVRPSVTGKPVSHTERMQVFGAKAPGFRNTTLRGELYYTDAKGKAIPFKDVSGILNMLPARSLERQRERHLQPRIAVFDILRSLGADTAGMTVAERQALAHQALKQLPSQIFHEPQAATDMSEKLEMLRTIRKGLNPRTGEGVMAVMPDQTVRKIKNREETTGYLTGLYPGTGRRGDSAGGLTFVTDKDNPVEGRVGTGFTEAELRDIVARIQELKGQPIRLEHQGMFRSGKLRAPSFKGFETDKEAEMHRPAAALQKMAQLGRAINTGLDRLANYGTYQTVQALPELAHESGLGHAQAIADTSFAAAADATGLGAKLIHGSRYAPPAVSAFARGLGNIASRYAAPAWAAGYAVDGLRVMADPYGRAEEAQKMIADYNPAAGAWNGVLSPLINNAAYGFAAPVSSFSAMTAGANELGEAVEDMRAAGRGSEWTRQQIAERQRRVAASKQAPQMPVTGVQSNMPTITPPQSPPQPLPPQPPPQQPVGQMPARPVSNVVTNKPEMKLGTATVRLQFTGPSGQVKAAACVEIADTPELRQRGLGQRAGLGGDTGMFFDKVGSYWMKDVEFPLDIMFVDAYGKILQKQAMAVEPDPTRPIRIYRGPMKSAHAIEMPGGWCDRNKIKAGDTIRVGGGG